MFKKSFEWPYSLLLPLGVLSLSINLYRVSNYLYTLISYIQCGLCVRIYCQLYIFLNAKYHTDACYAL